MGFLEEPNLQVTFLVGFCENQYIHDLVNQKSILKQPTFNLQITKRHKRDISKGTKSRK